MKLRPIALIFLALPAAAAAAQPGANGFGSLWTGWSQVNRQSVEQEQKERERLERDIATADAARMRALRNSGRDLGERVGEIVRLGDCAEGERLALEARDYALTAAVRAHCAVSRPR